MKTIPFIFVDDNIMYSSNGKFVVITKDDIENYIENDFTEEEVKSMLYYYLTDETSNKFSNEKNEYNQF